VGSGEKGSDGTVDASIAAESAIVLGSHAAIFSNGE
jgi:hypothetical protein